MEKIPQTAMYEYPGIVILIS